MTESHHLNRRLPNWVIPVVRTPFVILRAVLAPVYELTFGRLERRLARKHEEQLARDIQLTLKFLFSDYSARIVPNQGLRFPPPFDYACVTVEAQDSLIRICRGRGELSASFASKLEPGNWKGLTPVQDLSELSRVLQSHMKNPPPDRR